MDNGSIKPTTDLYSLVNIETGKVEDTNLKPLTAKDTQNHLWARGVKTRLVVCNV